MYSNHDLNSKHAHHLCLYIQEFSLRACMNALPTMQNLRLRGVAMEEFCPLCNLSNESTYHALIHCEFAAKVWSNWTECPIKLLDSIFDISFIALELLNFGTVQDLEVLFSTAWFIWYNRNQVIHEANFSPALQI